MNDLNYRVDPSISQEVNQLQFFTLAYLQVSSKMSRKKCVYCEIRTTEANRTVDHLIPKCRLTLLSERLVTVIGPLNKYCCCRACNTLKGDMSLREFYELVKASNLERKKAILRNIGKLIYLD